MGNEESKTPRRCGSLEVWWHWCAWSLPTTSWIRCLGLGFGTAGSRMWFLWIHLRSSVIVVLKRPAYFIPLSQVLWDHTCGTHHTTIVALLVFIIWLELPFVCCCQHVRNWLTLVTFQVVFLHRIPEGELRHLWKISKEIFNFWGFPNSEVWWA